MAKAGHQLSIADMFNRKEKRKSDLPTGSAKAHDLGVKRIKIDMNNVESDKENTLNGKAEHLTLKQNDKTSTLKCQHCRQLLDDVEMFPGDSSEAYEEFVALTHESLSLFVGNEETGRPQHKITNFSIYDKNAHLCPFDAGLIEKNVELFFSGMIKPVFVEDCSTENGVEGTHLGPINEWWTAGFDGGENALVGFSTAFADYFLMQPHTCYEKWWSRMQEKIYMSKIVIEYLSDTIEANYEDLVNQIQTCVPPAHVNLTKFTEESLLCHAQFVVEQVESYDSARGEGEDALTAHPCMRDLVHLAGVTLGKKKADRKRIVKVKKVVKASSTKATTTELVAFVTESFFKGTVDSKVSSNRRKRCGQCERCLQQDCQKCTACKDMVKYGGMGKSKQTCAERKCQDMTYDGDRESDDEGEENAIIPIQNISTHKGMRKSEKHPVWIGEPQTVDDNEVYYEAVQINNEKITLGDCVSVLPQDKDKDLFIGKIVRLWQDDKKVKMMHIDWYIRASETILGEIADKAELFLIDDCEDTKLDFVFGKVEVACKPIPDNWFKLGGEPPEQHSYDGVKTFFCQKWYDPVVARFEDPPKTLQEHECESCHHIGIKEDKSTPKAIQEICKKEKNILYEKAAYGGVTYVVGESVYLPVESFPFLVEKRDPGKTKNHNKKVDCEKYPEMYRKTGHVKGSNENVPEPFRIARILTIFRSMRSNGKLGEIKLKVSKFYRPENTHKDYSESCYYDLNMLYYSEETAVVELQEVCGKCIVMYEYDLKSSVVEYTAAGPDRFYFSESYDASAKSFHEPPPTASQEYSKQGNSKVSAKLTKVKKLENHKEIEEKDCAPSFSKLRTLDVFAGCGGLSEGFHQAGIADPCYAIELWDPAAQAYRLNNPGTVVFTEDCNVLLQNIMDGHEKNSCGQVLPQKGDIELLCGGPPCQGFSGMNRFNSREYSRFKNSLVVSYLSYCDYFRPRFFLLENVRNFVSFKNCMVLKLTLASLLKMGYQCTFGVLQAGHYGVAQTRRRAIILAAAPGEKLPFYPEPLHSFSLKSGSLTTQVDEKRYMNNITRLTSAPLRTITVRDAMSDLPKIPNGHSKLEIPYDSDPRSHFQRKIRGSSYQPSLRDHVCKDMNPIVQARMKFIPLAPGSDWRDLPNIQVKLSDGTLTKLLRYTHNDKKQHKSPNGDLRGVCACASGKPCDPMDRQFNTLIPWCLPHTGNRHNHWAGLYGRLSWDGFFSTTVTNPEPMGKQGRVLHPEQHRVVSVRECARSQGFPDTYRLFGSILDKHREVGNAVPPPMAKAIGLEIKKCLEWKMGDKFVESKSENTSK